MNQAFGWDVDRFVWFGGYPGSAELIEDEPRWKSFVQNALIETSISKDILMLSRIDKPALMRRVFELGCLYSGQILSYTKILGQLQDSGNVTTLQHYVTLLHTAGLLGGLEKYDAKFMSKRASSPKWQVHNTALVSAQRSEMFEEAVINRAEWGRVVESAVGAHLINAALSSPVELSYWRQDGKEVDFIIAHKGALVALEVKSGAGRAASAVAEFRKTFPNAKIFLIGDAGLKIDEFLSIPPEELF